MSYKLVDRKKTKYMHGGTMSKEKTVRLSVEIPERLRWAYKECAARRRVSISALIIKHMEDTIKRNGRAVKN
jgi:hypothetical protein